MKIMNNKFLTWWSCLAVIMLVCVWPASAKNARIEPLPDELEGVGVTEHLDDKLPLELEFTNENGETVQLKNYFKGEKPAILTLVYYSCPMLCNLILEGLRGTLLEIPWTPGKEFEILTISIDPKETHKLAKLKKQNNIKAYGKPVAAKGWHFLTGKENNIKKLAETVGFKYRYDKEKQQYYHSAVVFIVTPDARLSRYLYGIPNDEDTLKLSLVEASKGKIGDTYDKVLLYCFKYSADEGRYTLAAMNIMRAGALLTLLILGITLGLFWIKEGKNDTEVESQKHKN